MNLEASYPAYICLKLENDFYSVYASDRFTVWDGFGGSLVKQDITIAVSEINDFSIKLVELGYIDLTFKDTAQLSFVRPDAKKMAEQKCDDDRDEITEWLMSRARERDERRKTR